MPNPQDEDNILRRVGDVLQSRYESDEEFNAAFNQGELIRIPGSQGFTYEYASSEVLFWVDRAAYEAEQASWHDDKERTVHKPVKDYLQATHQISIIEDLALAISRRRTSPFVGAGLAAQCEYPTWGQFLRDRADSLEGIDTTVAEALIKGGKFLEAAEELCRHSESILAHGIRTEFRVIEDRGLPELATLLPQMTHGCIVTTNFDLLIETAFANAKCPLSCHMFGMQENNNFIERALRGERGILKLHGNADHKESLVLTLGQYELAYGPSGKIDFKRQLPKTLRQLFITQSFVFIGCSLEQDRTLDLFKMVASSGDFKVPDHFAFLRCPENPAEKTAKQSRLLDIGISPIWYKVGDANDHSQLTDILNYTLSRARATDVARSA